MPPTRCACSEYLRGILCDFEARNLCAAVSAHHEFVRFLSGSGGSNVMNLTSARPVEHHMRLLIVEDQSELADLVRSNLAREGFAVDVAGTVDEARAAVAAVRYDVVLLDLA